MTDRIERRIAVIEASLKPQQDEEERRNYLDILGVADVRDLPPEDRYYLATLLAAVLSAESEDVRCR
jgi:hypothetical protein